MSDDPNTPAQDPSDGFDPRANIYDSNTGEVTPVRRDAITGLDEFSEGWQHNTELPHTMSFTGWQMVDDDHPAGSGRPAYRVVHKCIRTVPFPAVNMDRPNLRISFANGPITLGAPVFDTALPARRTGDYLVPEWGQVTEHEGTFVYHHQPDPQIHIRAHQVTTPPCNHIEILYELPQGEWDTYEDMVAAGRAGISPITATMDLLYGERIIGPTITEEVGEVFSDWHWNRLLGGRTVALESQARLDQFDGAVFAATLGEAIERSIDQPADQRRRRRVASLWYWRAEADPDPVQRYIAYWLVVEALVLDENADIKPVKAAVRALLDLEPSKVAQAVGRMYGKRSGLVHGKVHEASAVEVADVRALARALLEYHSLGSVGEQRLDALRAAVLPDKRQDAAVV